MSAKTIKEIMEEESDNEELEGQLDEELEEESDDEEEDFSSDDDRCTACGSYNITIRSSGYVQCHDCNFLDRKEEDESSLDED